MGFAFLSRSGLPSLVTTEKGSQPVAGVYPKCQPMDDSPVATLATPKAEAFRKDFQKRFPKPPWWDRVDAIRLHFYEEFLNYWQCQARSSRQFFKAAYQIILDFPEDDLLVLDAIHLMYHGNEFYPEMEELQKFALNRYFDITQTRSNYRGKVADSLGGVVRNLYALYHQQSRYEEAIPYLERILTQREKELNDHLLQLISRDYAYSLWKTGKAQKALTVLDHALTTYVEGDWSKELNQLRTLIQHAAG